LNTYRILRLLVCGSSAYLAYQEIKLRRHLWSWILGATAILFNPVFPIRFSRSTWRYYDAVSAGTFLLWALMTRPPEPENQAEANAQRTQEPSRLEKGSPPAPALNTPSTSHKTKVLVGEDEPAIADVIAKMLEDSECDVAVEYTGLDAVYRAATFRPDIALLGFVMPRMDGVEAGISLSKISPRTKIVLITEPVPAETLESLKALGYNFDAFPAPFGPEDLRAMLSVWSCE